eukprot:1191622-Prorocentrum_minimum.AAC.2
MSTMLSMYIVNILRRALLFPTDGARKTENNTRSHARVWISIFLDVARLLSRDRPPAPGDRLPGAEIIRPGVGARPGNDYYYAQLDPYLIAKMDLESFTCITISSKYLFLGVAAASNDPRPRIGTPAY